MGGFDRAGANGVQRALARRRSLRATRGLCLTLFTVTTAELINCPARP